MRAFLFCGAWGAERVVNRAATIFFRPITLITGSRAVLPRARVHTVTFGYISLKGMRSPTIKVNAFKNTPTASRRTGEPYS